MYVDTIPNRKSRPTILLREGRREGKKTPKRTLKNLSKWPADRVEMLRLLLAGETMVPAGQERVTERTRPHGHVEAVLGTIRRLGLDRLIASRRSRERDLVVAMVAERILHPASKLATTRLWETTTLAEELKVGDADVDELYAALDWLMARQRRIEKKLARLHLREGGQALYDVSSSYYEGHTCPLAQLARSRDGKKGLPVIVYGVMTNDEGCPVAVDVYPGKTGDPSTVPDQVDKLRKDFGLEHVVLVGDRGMLTEVQIKNLKAYPQLGWISALRCEGIRKLVDSGALQMSLFDEQNLAEITSPDFPGERLVVCYNPLLAEERRRTRTELVAATEKELRRIEAEVKRRTKTPLKADEIGVKVGRVINRFKVAKHFHLTIENGRFEWARNEQAIAREAALDGIYVIRTSEPAERLSAADTVRSYKGLAHVEQAFRTLKGIDLRVRPIYLRVPDHVRAHIFLCLLAYYVQWHMRRALAPLLFDDEELAENRKTRDPVAPARPSASAKRKKATRRNAEGLPVHSFHTLLGALATRTRNYYRMDIVPKSKESGETITIRYHDHTEPDPLQTKALQLLGLFPVL
jgi:transposase